MYSNEEQKYSADYRRDSDSGFCSLKELPFAYAQGSGTDDRFNKEKNTPGMDWVISFCVRHKLSIRLPEKYSLRINTGFNEVQVTRCFDHLCAAFVELKFKV